MNRKINISLKSLSDVESAINELENLKKWISQKSTELNEKLAYVGAYVASTGFYEGGDETDPPTSVEALKENDGKVWKIRASGKAVFFIEFGAGVYYNGSEPYPEPRPSGVVGIGEYGLGHGKQDAWLFTDDEGKSHYTHGTPATMPMYRAKQEIKNRLEEIARQVFG